MDLYLLRHRGQAIELDCNFFPSKSPYLLSGSRSIQFKVRPIGIAQKRVYNYNRNRFLHRIIKNINIKYDIIEYISTI